MLNPDWSQVLKSDLDKLSQITSSHAKSTVAKLKEGERRVVTILFLDIQGFTAMSEKLDPEDVQLIIDNCFKILTHEVEKYHGYIDKYEGDRMMALFGSRHASEQDCERALRAALGMKEKFFEVNKILAERNIEIGIRIGVNTGLVVTGRIGKGRDQDFTVMGDAVNLASRLESNAPPGEIMISEETMRTAGDAFLYESLGKIEVKGKSEPISVFHVQGLNPHRSERWERSPFTKQSPYVSRPEEEIIQKRLKEVEQKKGFKSVAISGPAGSGKSRLAHEFMKRFRNVNDQVPMVFRGIAVGSHRAPYALFGAPIAKVLMNAQIMAELPLVQSPEQKEEWNRLKPVLEYLSGQRQADERMMSLEPKALQLEIHLAIRFLLEQLAHLAQNKKCGPLIIHFDDFQWIDHPSLEALSFLHTWLEALSSKRPNLDDMAVSIFFIFTYRPEYVLDPEFRKVFEVEEFSLKPLSGSDCDRILKTVLQGVHLSESDRDILVQRSGGNPFFLEELIQSLIDRETLVKKEGRWKLTGPIEASSLPDTVQRILVTRIDKLDRSHKESLMTASVVGETSPVGVLEDTAEKMGLSRQDFYTSMRSLEDLGFIYRRREDGLLGPQISFRHALTRDVVYSMILNHNKQILHKLVAETFERIHGEKARDHAHLLFHHFSNAGQNQKTLEYGFLALESLLRQYSAKEGLATIQTLKPLVDDPERKIRLLETEIKFHDFLGSRKEQLACIELLEAMGSNMSIENLDSKIGLYQAMYHSSVGDFRKAREFSQKGRSSISKSNSSQRLEMELLRIQGIACYNLGDYESAFRHYRQGLKISQEIHDRSAEGTFYNTIGLLHFNTSRLQEALSYHEKALDLMRSLGERRGEANALGNEGLIYWNLGDYSKALDQLKDSHQIFKEIGFKKGQAVTLGNRGVIHHKLGQYQEALRCYEKALTLRRQIHDRAGEGFDLVNIGVEYIQLEDYPKALEHLTRAKSLAEEAGSTYLLTENLNSLAQVYRKLGETDPSSIERAKEYAEHALSLASSHQLVPAEIKAQSNLGRIYWILDQKAQALEASRKAIELIEKHAEGAEGSEDDAYMNHYYLLLESGDREDAKQILKTFVELIHSRAKKIKSPKDRESFLQEVRVNRLALDEWEKNSS